MCGISVLCLMCRDKVDLMCRDKVDYIPANYALAKTQTLLQNRQVYINTPDLYIFSHKIVGSQHKELVCI